MIHQNRIYTECCETSQPARSILQKTSIICQQTSVSHHAPGLAVGCEHLWHLASKPAASLILRDYCCFCVYTPTCMTSVQVNMHCALTA